jgi:hypothetical protein
MGSVTTLGSLSSNCKGIHGPFILLLCRLKCYSQGDGYGRERRETGVYRVGKSGEKLKAGRVRGEQGFVGKRIELVLVLLIVLGIVVAGR